MSHIRYGVLGFGRANKTRLNEVNALINKALRCIYYKSFVEIVNE